MEIKLRTFIIIREIMDQITFGSHGIYFSYENYDILGWCIFEKSKFYILQDKKNHQLVKLPMIKDIICKKGREYDYSSNRMIEFNYRLQIVNTNGMKHTIFYQFDEPDELILNYYNEVKEFKSIAEKIGQFYI